jgi:hypothetical protein
MFANRAGVATQSSGGQNYTISRSLGFNGNSAGRANTCLTRTPATITNQQTWTWSSWVKRGKLGSLQSLFAAALGTAGFNECRIDFTASDTFELLFQNGSAVAAQLITTQVFRDASAWYHIVVVSDTTNATTANRLKVYVNGSQITAFGTATYPAQNATFQFNKNALHSIGGGFTTATQTSPNAYFTDGSMTEINFIDGQVLTPSSFGRTDEFGSWSPIKYSGTYGTNGFYLNFKDNSDTTSTTIGKDNSGNNNNWTPNGFVMSAGSGDSKLDTPTNNYCTLNPSWANSANVIFERGNSYKYGNGSGYSSVIGTIGITATGYTAGKWYWECTVSNNGSVIGVGDLAYLNISAGNSLPAPASSPTFYSTSYGWGISSGYKWNNNTPQVGPFSYSNGQTLGIALDLETDGLSITYDGINFVTIFYGFANSGKTFVPTFEGNQNDIVSVNFGAHGFIYSIPAGHKPLCAANLKPSAINSGRDHFAATTYTGTGSNLSISNTDNGHSFQPDLVWIKGRSVNYEHAIFDAVRGVRNVIRTSADGAEATEAAGTSLTSFDTGGFSLGTNGTTASTNVNGSTFVAWQWKASQGIPQLNTDGTITSTVSVNRDAGFSIVTYTGTGVNATVGHGLSVAPKMFFVKKRSTIQAWGVWHTALAGTQYMVLNTTAAAVTSATLWNSTIPTSTVFSLGTDSQGNSSGQTYVAYCWSEVPGYSKFGYYTGNGTTNGPFMYCGFRPRFVLIKVSSTTGDWAIQDSSRSTYNAANALLWPDLVNAEYTTAGVELDYLSNGFKVRNTNALYNSNAATYIFMAFAENPFKNANAR